MARIRTIKPSMYSSLTVCAWPVPIRWTFAGLFTYVDDDGRGLDETRLIKSELYPLDDAMTPRKIEQHLCVISESGPLCRYEVDGLRLLHITSWGEHQRINRPTPSKIAPCPIHENSLRAHGGLSEGSREMLQGREGKGRDRKGREESVETSHQSLRSVPPKAANE